MLTPQIGHRVMPAFLSRVRTASLHCLWDARLVRDVAMSCVPACVWVCGVGCVLCEGWVVHDVAPCRLCGRGPCCVGWGVVFGLGGGPV